MYNHKNISFIEILNRITLVFQLIYLYDYLLINISKYFRLQKYILKYLIIVSTVNQIVKRLNLINI